MIEFYTLKAGAQAALLIRMANAIDHFNYRVYLKSKNLGMEDTHFRLPAFKKESSK
ncbi:hypothetical protein ACVWWN_000451 [Mycobacterium sp. URHB0021]